MSRKRSSSKRILVIVLCLMLLISFVVAQTLTLQQTRNTNSASGAPPASPSTPPISQPKMSNGAGSPLKSRDLTLYDKTGPFAIDKRLAKEAHNAILVQIRSFLWDHWQQRRHGHLVINSHNIAGYPTIYKFFVEPDATGRWHIALERDDNTEGELFYLIERVEMPEDGPPTLPPAPRQEPRGSSTLGLHLKHNEQAASGLVL